MGEIPLVPKRMTWNSPAGAVSWGIMTRMGWVLIVAMAVVAGGGGGCRSAVAPVKGPHAPTTVGSVELFQEPPRRYEVLGVVEVADHVGTADHFNADAVMGALMAKAAALGANGLLLQSPAGEKRIVMMGGYYQEEFYRIPVRSRPKITALGQAIWVRDKT